jgi:hypothetical protein
LSGVQLGGSGADGNVICGNYIGTDKSGTVDLGNSQHGVLVCSGARENKTGAGNVIYRNDWVGVRIEGYLTVSNTVTENSIYGNDLEGIDLVMAGSNNDIAAPSIDSAICASISGMAPANSTVEVFTGPDDEGKTYLATCSADGDGNWSVTGAFTLDAYVTATAIDAAGNTSEFSAAAVPGTCLHVFVPLVTKNY